MKIAIEYTSDALKDNANAITIYANDLHNVHSLI
jgi:hypothetical protein